MIAKLSQAVLLAAFLSTPVLAQTAPATDPISGAVQSLLTQEHNQGDFYEREKQMLLEKIIEGTATDYEVSSYYLLLNITANGGNSKN